MRIILSTLTLALLSACATTTSNWNDTTVTSLRAGMSKSDVQTMFGAPTSTSQQSGGKDVWTYRRAADTTGVTKGYDQFLGVMTLGAVSGENALITDILSIMFAGDQVEKYKYDEAIAQNTMYRGGFDE